MAALREAEFTALQGLLKAPSRDAVRQLCQECFASPPAGLGPLARRACPGLAAAPEEAAQLVSALHNLTRHVVYRGLTKPEDVLALFPENFHQNLKNLLTKIILENVSAWRNEAQASQTVTPEGLQERADMKLDAALPNIGSAAQLLKENGVAKVSLPRLVDMDWRVDIKTSSDSISRMAVPTCLLQLKIQEDAALCGNNPVVSALTVEMNKETLDTMLEGLGRIRDQLSAVANK